MKVEMVEQHNSTRETVERAREGDRGAFDELVMRFRDRLASSIRGWSRFRLGPRLDVDEVLHETFVRAFRSIESFEWRDEDSFLRWLCGVARRAMAQLIQDRRGVGATETAENVPVSGPSPSRIERRHERFDRLEAALDQLSPEYRTVLLLSRVEGLTAPQIADRMDRSPNAVRHLLVRALRELRERFGDETASLNLPDRQFRGEGGDDD